MGAGGLGLYFRWEIRARKSGDRGIFLGVIVGAVCGRDVGVSGREMHTLGLQPDAAQWRRAILQQQEVQMKCLNQ